MDRTTIKTLVSEYHCKCLNERYGSTIAGLFGHKDLQPNSPLLSQNTIQG